MFASRNGQRRYRHWAAVSGLCVLALVAAACSQGTTPSAPTTTAAGKPVKGGTLNMLGAGDVDYMDPNVSYYSVGYLGAAAVEPAAVHLPRRRRARRRRPCPTWPRRFPTADNGGISADGKTYTITIRQGAKWNTDPARQVTAADMVRGVKRTCNPVQPFGGIPDFADLIAGYQTFCDGFAKVAPDARRAIAKYIDDTALPGVVAKDDQTVVFKLTQPATYFVDMLTLPAFSPAPKEVLEVPAGQHRRSASTRSPTARTRSRRGRRPRRSCSRATRPGTRRPTRSARPTSTRSWSTRRSARSPSSSSCRPARQRRHGVGHLPAAVAAARR